MGKQLWNIDFKTLNTTDEHANGWDSKYTHTDNLTDGVYKADGQGTTPSFGINAVDIDWNGADFSGIPNQSSAPSTINTTGDLLKVIKYASGNNSVNGLFGKSITSTNATYTIPIVTGFEVENGHIINVFMSTLGNLKEAILNITADSDPGTTVDNTYYKEIVVLGLNNGNKRITDENKDQTFTISGNTPIYAYREEHITFTDQSEQVNTEEITISIDGGDFMKDTWGYIKDRQIILSDEPVEGHTVAKFIVPVSENDTVRTSWSFYVERSNAVPTPSPSVSSSSTSTEDTTDVPSSGTTKPPTYVRYAIIDNDRNRNEVDWDLDQNPTPTVDVYDPFTLIVEGSDTSDFSTGAHKRRCDYYSPTNNENITIVNNESDELNVSWEGTINSTQTVTAYYFDDQHYITVNIHSKDTTTDPE